MLESTTGTKKFAPGICIGLGSNMGEAESNVAKALVHVAELPGVRVVARSPVYRTEPQDFRDQAWFLNQVAMLECSAWWTPQRLMHSLLSIESRMGRNRIGPEKGPRIIDIDLLTFGTTICLGTDLVLPHPRMHRRAFVLVPLFDLDPEFVIPGPNSSRIDAVLANLRFTVENGLIRQK
ncbi:MAG: 2-amino-4-hydroxy-6-hydroxymethyldihydropteridine diphosphokinase [Deltaproteobacteria bacterium]|nr:2-amino-4-hydroxy-6-hydroxymethyldihydropteridine diphosphokinase [Deltaproteobacteria bacterium]